MVIHFLHPWTTAESRQKQVVRRLTTSRGWFRSCTNELGLPVCLLGHLPYTRTRYLSLLLPSVLLCGRASRYTPSATCVVSAGAG